ncbi:hypothetical protein N7450_011688 [Penicillium hetheringtonii]|uniref:phosphopyruvate hydratase n=1 Tax=Penicillium hetheringtonii TaxID=911720 RepID=A0AAD6DAE5_9EURO|nr:hypothetical protein N7450_011688 [Penicillium hetheringtonii]
MIAPVGASSIAKAVRIGSEVYQHLKKVITEKFGSSVTGIGDKGGFAPPISESHQALNFSAGKVERWIQRQDQVFPFTLRLRGYKFESTQGNDGLDENDWYS